MTREKGYKYLKGLAELAKKINRRKLQIFFRDLDSPLGGNCDYCGKALRYEIIFKDGKIEIGLGQVCASHLIRYLGMPTEKLDHAINFYNKYLKLCEKAKKTPKARIELEKIEEEIEKIKGKMRMEREKRIKEGQQLALKNMDKIIFIKKRYYWLTEWEKGFVQSAEHYMTQKMANILNKIYRKVSDIDESEIIEQVKAHTKLDFLVLYGQYKIWNKIYKILEDIDSKKRHSTLTKKEIKLIDKWFNILAKKYPEYKDDYQYKVKRKLSQLNIGEKT